MSSTTTVEVVALPDGLLDAGQALALPQLRDVDQAVAAGHEVHERTERRRLHDRDPRSVSPTRTGRGFAISSIMRAASSAPSPLAWTR